MGTIFWAGPLEALTVWVFRAALAAARHGDRIIAATVTIGLRWQERARERHQLASLNDIMLRDIGLTRVDVERECQKPFWMP